MACSGPAFWLSCFEFIFNFDLPLFNVFETREQRVHLTQFYTNQQATRTKRVEISKL
jgi:hypothetical protein